MGFDDDLLDQLSDLANTLTDKQENSKLEFYQPYGFQKRFHNARDIKNNLPEQKGLMAANQVGKTFCGAMEMSMHLTGLYPEWYKGRRFNKASQCTAVSNSHDTCRDICQNELFGDPEDDVPGGGTIPKDLIIDTTSKPGVPNAFNTALVRHQPTGGTSVVHFAAYEQGFKKHMGKRRKFNWLDEEPPQDVWSQYSRSILATGGYNILTFTPELGVTGVVDKFMNDLTEGMVLINATWEDADHFKKDPKRLKNILDQIPAHERDMRSKGIPQMGSGLVFPVTDDAIKCDPFKIPNYFRRVIGIDFGYDHPFSAASIAYDADRDIVYLVDEYKESHATPPIHASRIRGMGAWIPVVWPHDGQSHEKGSGIILAEQYRKEGLNLMYKQFSNPPPVGVEEGKGGIAREPGLHEMLMRMQDSRFKVFSTLTQFFQEKRLYHRKDGKVVDRNDDLISATRYAVMSLRFAQLQSIPKRVQNARRGIKNW